MTKRLKVTIEASKPRDGQVAPVAAYFPSVGAEASTSAPLQIELYGRSNSSKAADRQDTFLIAKQGAVEYVGQTSADAAPTCNYAVGVYDKQTGALTLLPAAGNAICRLEPRLEGINYTPKDEAGLDIESLSREERIQRNKSLVEGFGSTRRKRQLHAREEAVVHAESLTSGKAIAGILSEVSAKAAAQGLTREAVAARSAEHRHVPPHVPEATTGPEAYPLRKLIPPELWGSVDGARLLKAAKSPEVVSVLQEKQLVPQYVLDRLYLLKNESLTRQQAEERAQALAFLAALLQLHCGRPTLRADPDRGGLPNLANNLKMRPDCLRGLLLLFYNQSQDGNTEVWQRPKDKSNMLIAYILVAALLAENCFLTGESFEELRTTLKLAPQDLVPRLREVGATVNPTSATVKNEEGEAVRGRTYTVGLLKETCIPARTLAMAFPKPKLNKRK